MLFMHFFSSLLIDIQKTNLSLSNDSLDQRSRCAVIIAMDLAMLQEVSLFDELNASKVTFWNSALEMK